MIVVRKNLTKEKGEVRLFPEIRYLFYVTNDPQMTPEEVAGGVWYVPTFAVGQSHTRMRPHAHSLVLGLVSADSPMRSAESRHRDVLRNGQPASRAMSVNVVRPAGMRVLLRLESNSCGLRWPYTVPVGLHNIPRVW